MTKKDVRKIESKLCHVLGRIKCISGDSVERLDLLADALALNQAFEDKRDAFRKPAELELLEATLEKILDLSTSTPVEPTLPARNVNMAATSNVKSVPVYKWGLKFSGQGDSSVNAFLQRVDELMTARHVDQNEVFLSALDLFEGNALKWYRNNRTSVSNWEELKRGLRSEFQPLNYNEKLFGEIRRRTQGHDEGVGIYLDNMKGLLSRLTCPVSEAAELKIIMDNVLPFYQSQLGLEEVESTSHLRKLCKQLEARREAVENFAPPNRRLRSLEPDLAYLGGLPPTSVSFLTSEKTHVHFVTHFLKTLLLTLREMRNFTDEFCHLLDIATLQFAFVA
jgi:hypothetical protein